MDSSWQSKCTSPWPLPLPSTPLPSPMTPFSQLPMPSATRNQMDVNGGHCFHPYIAQGSSPTLRTDIQEPLVFSTLNLGSRGKSAKPELGNSFLALLSGSSQQLQCDFQQLSNSKPPVSAHKLSVHPSNIVVSSAGSGVSAAQFAAFPQLNSNESTCNKTEPGPVVSSRQMPISTSGQVAVLRNDMHAANLHVHGAEYAKLALNHEVHGNEMGTVVPSLRSHLHGSRHITNGSQHQMNNLQTSPIMPLEAKSTLSVLPSAFMGGHPRVFCLGKWGDLLLSDKGFLGVVCLCHGLPMSVAQFSEHAGSFAVNPGDAVRLASGETVAQWRRSCFLKCGLRILDDSTGWDWPDGISASGGLMKCKATSMSNVPKPSDMFPPVDPFGAFMRSGQPCNDFASPNRPFTGRTVLENSVNRVTHDGQQKDALDVHSIFNGFGSTCPGILPAQQNKQTMQVVHENPVSKGRTTTKIALDKGAQNNGYQSAVDCIDFISKGGNAVIAASGLGNVKTLGTVSDVIRCNSPREVFVVDKDAAPSNIELRLGQPSQQNQTLEGSIPAAVRPQLFGGLFDSRKPQFLEQLVHGAVKPRVVDVSRRNPLCSPGISDFNQREKQIQSNLVFDAPRSANDVDSAKLEQLKGDAAKSSLISMFISHFSSRLDGNMQTQVPDNRVNNEHFMAHKERCGMEGISHMKGLGASDDKDKGKGLRTIVDNCSYPAAKPNSVFPIKQVADGNPFTGVLGGNCLHSSSVVHLGQLPPCLHQSHVMLSDAASNVRNPNQLGKDPSLGGSNNLDHIILRSVNPAAPASAGSCLFSPVVPLRFSSSSSIGSPNLSSALSNKGSDVNQDLIEENLRLLALRHVVELSKQEPSISSPEMNPEQGLLCYSLPVEMQGKGCKGGIIASEELREGACDNNKQDASKNAVGPSQPGYNHYLSAGLEKLPDMPGQNKCSKCDISLHSNRLHVQFPPCCDHSADEQPLLRLGRAEKNIATDSDQLERCFWKESNPCFLVNCSSAFHSKCLTGCCASKGKAPIGVSREHTECVGVSAPGLVASVSDNGNMIPENERVVRGHAESFKKHCAQWRDVPNKVTGNCNAASVERRENLLDAEAVIEDQLADTAAKIFNGTSQDAEPLKEQQMSNAFSGCSALAVTEVSIEVNNLDSCIMDSGDDGCVHGLVVDEGSGIEKCGSSDVTLGNGGGANFPSVDGRIASNKAGSPKLLKQSRRDLVDELKSMNSFKLKKIENPTQAGSPLQEQLNHAQQFKWRPKAEKTRKVMKWKRLDSSFSVHGISSMHDHSCKSNSEHSEELHLHSSREIDVPLQSEHGKKKTHCIYTFGSLSLKRKRSTFSSAKTLSRKRNFHMLEDHHSESEDEYQPKKRGDIHSLGLPKSAAEKKVKSGLTLDLKAKQSGKVNHVDTGQIVQCIARGHIKGNIGHMMGTHNKKVRPVVCGNSGIISNGKLAKKPAKIVSLSSILKVAKRCTVIEDEPGPELASNPEERKACFHESGGYYGEKDGEGEAHNMIIENEVEPKAPSGLETKKAFYNGNGKQINRFSMLKKDSSGVHKASKFGALHGSCGTQMKPTSKGTRQRSLSELIGKENHEKQPVSLSHLAENEHSQLMLVGSCLKKFSQRDLFNALRGEHPSFSEFCRKNSTCSLQADFTFNEGSCLKNAEDGHGHTSELRISGTKHPFQVYCLDSDTFCCVCGRSNKDEMNKLLECSRCSIRVHQACYGVSKVPKGRWSCRPCRTTSWNIVCVLCGYGGGAMTRAIRSRNIVKSLLEGWIVGGRTKFVNSIVLSDTVQDELGLLKPIPKNETSLLEVQDLVPVMRSINIGPFPRDAFKKDLWDSGTTRNSSCQPGNFLVHNSITAGVLDPTVTQWVHMVCGLWTPGTWCPNVDTMRTFDVSGACPKKNMVCSMCNRPGGSCIECRVVNCSVRFHPWCAHQKGLLQSEIEGVDDEKVGFYGRCMFHATNRDCRADNHHSFAKIESPREKEFTCARTGGYKGRKGGEGIRHNFHVHSNDISGCLVPQEQINAWLHINGQKSSIKGLGKSLALDIEYDCRKEYARYKQAKGWKHLVVYKSGIHALGLYTSQFISRGAMVVEYVGEIVGLRVADKRETEYQSGRKLQYKGACYFFRIDKEYIIDATRKGGIARFVNHSCLPNCVAKVISVRNEKKVVFFAERDINPGEEITYDYHFNHEDEGKKIPCFCNSKNCRRYLN